MAKIGPCKSPGWMALILFSGLLAVIAQPGFLSIDCGGKSNYTDNINISWVPDTNYIYVGQTASTRNTSLASYLQNVRLFPKPLKKSCYQVAVKTNVRYLLRFWFAVGNYKGFRQFPVHFALSIETPGLLTVHNISIPNNLPAAAERIIVSTGEMLYICLIKISETDDPFINAMELRALRNGMYPEAKPGRMLYLVSRYDVGGNSSIRYPQDNFDRIWASGTGFLIDGASYVKILSSEKPISTNTARDLPPAIVMRTAIETVNLSFTFDLNGELRGGANSLLLLYFAELQAHSMTKTRSVNVLINGQPEPLRHITVEANYSAVEAHLIQIDMTNYFVILERADNSSYGPILNGMENYVIVDTDMSTYIGDIEAVEAIKTRFDIKTWISDPCYVIAWEGIGCNNSSSIIRISEINLSGMNLAEPIPQNIAQLNALVSLSLDNNHLTGTLPNLSSLTMLEKLHLQNNNLTGTVPEWLAGLGNLTELFIDNNNFSGEIPRQLLKPSLKISYSGNHNLYLPPNSDNDRLKWILGITISGSLALIVLVLIAGVVAHQKKSRSKEKSKVERESKHGVENESKREEDNSMVILPNTTKSQAFTLDDIMTATKDFSHKIGQGGFGSVFFGKLEQGTDIAVKVLSLFSKQGVQEFLNEVDLLSRVHHRNLVSLLGYCNESRELMLVYEHMSGGSLKDHLYGPTAEHSQLNWKTRLKIASDAAQGLEYLHVGCTPKIIHRDIKTANILLDRNFNGKLSDLGLSRVTIDGETSHVTTTVKGTLGYLDPEYFSTQMLTERSDVYSFGVVLLEIICGRQPINVKLCGEQLNLIRWVTPYVEMDENRGKIGEIIDKRLGINYDIKSITNVAKLAIRCVQAEPSSRPHVSEVVAELKEAIKLENDKASLISEIDIEYGDLSVVSSEPREMDSVESSCSKITTVTTEGR